MQSAPDITGCLEGGEYKPKRGGVRLLGGLVLDWSCQSNPLHMPRKVTAWPQRYGSVSVVSEGTKALKFDSLIAIAIHLKRPNYCTHLQRLTGHWVVRAKLYTRHPFSPGHESRTFMALPSLAQVFWVLWQAYL